MERVVVIGAGVMGSALAIHLGNKGVSVNLWGTKWDVNSLGEMGKTRTHEQLKVKLPKSVQLFYENDLEKAFQGVSLVIIAVLSQGMESISEKIAPYLTKYHYVLSVTKGIDENSLKTMSNVIEKSIPKDLRSEVDIIKLGGPIIAVELAQGKYTEGIFASSNLQAAKYAKDVFKSPKFKGNISQDIIGVDLCAAFKNSYAIAMGIVEGIEGDMNNPKAALMARGTIEMAHIVEAYGGSRETALGIAGVGDYYVTSQGGRNGIFGGLLGEGKTMEEALNIMENQTVEGIAATLNGYKLLKELEVKGKINISQDLPLFKEIYNILYKDKPVKEAMKDYWASE